MDVLNSRLQEHDVRICKLESKEKEYDKFMVQTAMQYEHLEKALTKKAEFWDKVKVSITTSVILFFVMWILNSSGIFGG